MVFFYYKTIHFVIFNNRVCIFYIFKLSAHTIYYKLKIISKQLKKINIFFYTKESSETVNTIYEKTFHLYKIIIKKKNWWIIIHIRNFNSLLYLFCENFKNKNNILNKLIKHKLKQSFFYYQKQIVEFVFFIFINYLK